MVYREIKIKNFLQKYKGINANQFGRLSHKDLDKFHIEGYRRIPFALVNKNLELVSNGSVIIIIDDYNKKAPYAMDDRYENDLYGFTPEYEEEYCLGDEKHVKCKRR